jgi:lipopolysaccharide/colanic/teichoic acid biosynthesis glycosyltransferase
LLRFFDIIFSLIGLIVLLPIFIIIAIIIKLTDKGTVFYIQQRIGKNEIPFRLIKFRTMYPKSAKNGLLTVGGKDARITPIGYYLRKYKIDELPQLFNVLIGDMSIVGPRPEVKKYVDLYTPEQKQILTVLPGITDYASVLYKNENEILGKAANAEAYYIQIVMPRKISINKLYLKNNNINNYFRVIFLTLRGIFKK